MRAPRLLIIADLQACPPWSQWLPAALAGGARHLLFRAPGMEDASYLQIAQQLHAQLTPHGAMLLLHNRPHLLPKLPGAGLHMSDGPPSLTAIRHQIGPQVWLGRSCHTLHGGQHAFAQGADYITLSPLFPTLSHPGAAHLGVAQWQQWAAQLPGPVLALGGITADNAHLARAAGAYGVALIRGICGVSDPQTMTARLLGREIGAKE
ncbi:thiamine monophosphate synthase [Magnetococcus marinus MC-1]|uniref:Thiamine monophosphate synthase n=1 Tax=Magnetococcus marinus (strain ATCC BAA-1437 / JCM 17883 / MC-1) TaxID=156889 RepID=A0L5B1_MAGMM|nr:thiamine phosphate synthase [Magnetococcus marinus]ABK43154.1 thiamine monophosphate synthase [Magnetococcus marinus MC-1]